MAQPYLNLVGAPPHPKTLAFLAWYHELRALRIAYCAQVRTTNYYFAQAGNDSTGAGTQASPYKTIAKANALIAASSGNIGVFFKRGDTWTETAGPTDDGKSNVTIGAWGPTYGVAKPVISGTSANQSTQDGVLISGDGSWVDGLHVTNWGTTSASNYPVRVGAIGTNAALVSNCDADTGNYHIFGHDGGGTATGGIAIFVACTGGILALSSGTVFVSYAYGGGQEFIIDSCVATSGYSSGVSAEAVYSHTVSGTVSLGIVNRLHCLAGSNAVAVAVGWGNTPTASTPAAARCFEIDTYQEMASGSGISVGQNNVVRINGIYNIEPPVITARAFGNVANNCWSYNTIFVIDGTNIPGGGDYYAWWNAGASSGGNDSNFQWEHCAVQYQNWAMALGYEYYTLHGNGSYGSSASLQNCIISAVSSSYIYCGLAGSLSNSNAYYDVTDWAGNQFYNDPRPVGLAGQPQIGLVGASPTAVSQVYQAAKAPADGVALEYDAMWRPRPLSAAQSIGPLDAGAWIRQQLKVGDDVSITS